MKVKVWIGLLWWPGPCYGPAAGMLTPLLSFHYRHAGVNWWLHFLFHTSIRGQTQHPPPLPYRPLCSTAAFRVWAEGGGMWKRGVWGWFMTRVRVGHGLGVIAQCCLAVIRVIRTLKTPSSSLRENTLSCSYWTLMGC